MKKNKKIILMSILIATLLALVINYSYSFFIVTKTQTGQNIVNSSCFDVLYTDDSDAISLSSQIPISDNDGLKKAGYTFTIKNNCDTAAYYNVNLEDVTTGNKILDTKYIKVGFDNKTPQVLNTFPETQATIKNARNSHIITSGSLAAKGTTGDTATYTIKLWVDYDTPATDETVETKFSSKVSVVSQATTDESLLSDMKYEYVASYNDDGTMNADITVSSPTHKITEYSDNGTNYTSVSNPSNTLKLTRKYTNLKGKIYVKDDAGNTKEIANNGQFATAYNDSIIITTVLDLKNNGSNIAKYEYSLDNSNWNSAGSTVSFTKPSNDYTVYARLTDTEGNTYRYSITSAQNDVAKLGDKIFSCLNYAFKTSGGNDFNTIYLLKDHYENLVATTSKKVILDLQEHTLNATETYTIINYGSLQITNGTLKNNDIAISNQNGATLKVLSGVIESSKDRAISSYGNTEIAGGTIKTTSTIWSAIATSGTSTLTLSGGNITGSVAPTITNYGGVININDGSKILNSGDLYVINNKSGTINITGGNVSGKIGMMNQGTVEISGGTIDTINTSIVNDKTGTINMSGGTLKSAALSAIDNYGLTTILEGTLSTTASTRSTLYNQKVGIYNIKGGTISCPNNGCINNQGTSNLYSGTLEGNDKNYYIIKNGSSNNSEAILNIEGLKTNTNLFLSNYAITNMKGGEITSTSTNLTNFTTGVFNMTGGKLSSTGRSCISNQGTSNLYAGTLEGNTKYFAITNGSSSNSKAILNIDGLTTTVDFFLGNYAVANMKNGEITSTSTTIYNNATGLFNMTGGKLVSTGGTCIGNQGTSNLYAGTLEGNTKYFAITNGSSSNSKAILNIDGLTTTVDFFLGNHAVANMKNGEITSNSTNLYNYTEGVFNMTGGTLASSSTTVVVSNLGTATITDGTITATNANAITNRKSLTLKGNTNIQNNSSSYPTIYNHSGSTYSAEETVTITNNGGGKTVYNAS